MKSYFNFFNLVEKRIIKDLPLLDSMRHMRNIKADNSFVTDADFHIQDIIIRSMQELDEKTILVSEEIDNQEVDLTREEVVVTVDPLDGTENFTSGLSEWGVGISIYKKGLHQASCILLPEMKRRLVSGQNFKSFSSRIKGLSSSISQDSLQSLTENNEYRIMGCSMYNLYNVIRGSYSSYENIGGVNSWDILPGINIALENGFRVKVNEAEYTGEFLQPNQKYRIKVYR